MTSVTSRAQQYSQGKLRLKRWVFRRLWKSVSDCADVTWCGRLFQTRMFNWKLCNCAVHQLSSVYIARWFMSTWNYSLVGPLTTGAVELQH